MLIRKMKLAVGKDEETGESIMKPVHIEKINNGFIFRVCGGTDKEIEYVKSLNDSPNVLAKLLGVNGEMTGKELSESVKYESGEEEKE